MSADSTLPIQLAVRAALVADADVTALISGRVYDYVPDNVVFPYVSFGQSDLVLEEGQDLEMAEVTMQIDTWSTKPGRVEMRQVMAAISNVLHRSELSLSGHAFTLCRLTLQVEQDDPDTVSVHGIQQFTFTTQKD